MSKSSASKMSGTIVQLSREKAMPPEKKNHKGDKNAYAISEKQPAYFLKHL